MVERFTLTDDLDGVMERVIDSNRKNESVFCAPVSFFGKSRVAENARFLHAFAIDLDGVGVQELKNMLKQFRNGRDPKFAADKWVSLPRPPSPRPFAASLTSFGPSARAPNGGTSPLRTTPKRG